MGVGGVRAWGPLQSLSQAKHAMQVSTSLQLPQVVLWTHHLGTVPGLQVRSGPKLFLFLACSQPLCQLSTSGSAIKVGRGGRALAGAPQPLPVSLQIPEGLYFLFLFQRLPFCPVFLPPHPLDFVLDGIHLSPSLGQQAPWCLR